ncbi:SIR2 family NAD-dependent protein deacylase [Parapedobacter indicus]|uniref:NAD-dependent protein deacylase n=1 Tax=Parapedobacter indicus TaxID=1477437 RepID=A0A1I3QRA8_9SPHI|nr:NAD-dependent deacylase [Parapedobacter indicus]PPL00216.1 NAD-dependent deacetylase [Parapedobacter indicus]SFJ36674.1 NAD-dependent deacetylase [Parapedobacter indicus]
MERIVVFTGAGISAESGLRTFRGADGLWEGYRVEEVATPEAWERNPELVQHFYNVRRKAVLEARPNTAHLALAKLEEKYPVTIVTQNIDNLHERAGSSHVLHLHGLITKAQSSVDPTLVYSLASHEIRMGELCELGSQLRPHVVWFGEAVPTMGEAIGICRQADIFIVVGTSLQVYPAAGLLDEVPTHAVKYFVDPQATTLSRQSDIICFDDKATIAVPKIVEKLLA